MPETQTPREVALHATTPDSNPPQGDPKKDGFFRRAKRIMVVAVTGVALAGGLGGCKANEMSGGLNGDTKADYAGQELMGKTNDSLALYLASLGPKSHPGVTVDWKDAGINPEGGAPLTEKIITAPTVDGRNCRAYIVAETASVEDQTRVGGPALVIGWENHPNNAGLGISSPYPTFTELGVNVSDETGKPPRRVTQNIKDATITAEGLEEVSVPQPDGSHRTTYPTSTYKVDADTIKGETELTPANANVGAETMAGLLRECFESPKPSQTPDQKPSMPNYQPSASPSATKPPTSEGGA